MQALMVKFDEQTHLKPRDDVTVLLLQCVNSSNPP
jgi:hypothetical protein